MKIICIHIDNIMTEYELSTKNIIDEIKTLDNSENIDLIYYWNYSDDIIECYGNERIWINSAGDWGPSDPLSVPKCHVEMRRRGHKQKLVEKISLENPLAFLGQSGRFILPQDT